MSVFRIQRKKLEYIFANKESIQDRKFTLKSQNHPLKSQKI